MEDPEVVAAVLSMTIAVATGDDEAVDLFLRTYPPPDLAVAGAEMIWRLATALGQKVDPPHTPLQMIHIFARALQDPGGEGT